MDAALTIPAGRVALFGGIYSNYVALDAALESARRHGVDASFCLGDLGAFGPHPDRVFPLLRDAGVTVIAGNYDDSIGRGLDDCQCGYTDPRDNLFARLSYRYTYANTSPSNRRYLATLPQQMRLELGGWRVLLCHGSPRQQNEFLWESTSPDPFLERLCDEYEADVIAVTHSGIKWRRTLPSGRLVVNVGVLGRPENDGTTRVWYSLLTAPGRSRRSAAEDIDVRFVPVEYDHGELAAAMRAERLPAEFIATIETGWWTTCLEVLPARERRRGRH